MKGARKQYELEAARIRMQLIELQYRLEKHEKNRNVCNWAHVGDLQRVVSGLTETLAAI